MSEYIQTTENFIPEFGYQRATGQQYLDPTGEILKRQFSLWEFGFSFSANLIPSKPEFYFDDDIDSYYAVTRDATNINYFGARELAVGSEAVIPTQNFRGWLKTKTVFDYTAIYLNKEIGRLTWQPQYLLDPYSNIENYTGSYVLSIEGEDDVSFSTTGDRISLEIPHYFWGMRKLSSSVIAKLGNSELISDVDTVIRDRTLHLEKTSSLSSLVIILKGELWQPGDLSLQKIEEQEIIYHNPGAPESVRLTPPQVAVNANFASFNPIDPDKNIILEGNSWNLIED